MTAGTIEAGDRMTGFVSLVGAGPGDPELLTLKAMRRLEQADLVLHDALVDGEILRHAARAHCFFVGKRARRATIDQDTINRLLVRAARRGARVVRLKCGDPFVLGRGGEEALALASAGVPFEVIPGVSSAVAAPGLAGIPVTHRGVASGFAVLSGHAESAWRPILEGIQPGALTLVVLMGLSTRAPLARFLQERGWPASTPAAMLAGASRPGAWSWIGTLGGLARAPAPPDPAAPATLCVGEVVALASSIAPFDGRAASAAAREAVAAALSSGRSSTRSHP